VKNTHGTASHLKRLSSILICLVAFSAGADDSQTSDDFFRGYITSILQHDLKWEPDSYRLEIQNSVATLTIIKGGSERRTQAEEVLARVDGLKEFHVVVGAEDGVKKTKKHHMVSFPKGYLFRPLIADPKEPQTFVTIAQVDAENDNFTAALVGIGGTFGLLRWPSSKSADRGWQLNFFASAFSQFNLDTSSDDLINTDYLVGVSSVYRRGRFSTRLRLFHQSSHLGDEFILGGTAPERIDLSVEATDATFAYDWGNWRGYAGAAYLFDVSPSDLEKGGLQAGFDYVGRTRRLLKGRLVAGLHLQSFQERNWTPGTSLQVGLKYGRPWPGTRGIRIMLEAYNGFVPYGQFFGGDVNYYGIGLYFDP
jgi:Protein of unknown function (DUF1207)